MKIVIIGTGNVATVLARKLKLGGHSILQVYGRNEAAAAALAAQLSATACTTWTSITQEAALYIVSVADKALESVATQLLLKDQLVVHTAGAVSMEVFKNVASSYGVFYPFQTIRKEIEPMPELPLMIDANTAIARQTLLQVAESISGKVTVANDTARMQYHLCAVMTSNFSNYLNVLAEDYCYKHGLDFSNLLPLFDETARRLHYFSPRQVQTGPAIRKDIASIQQHLVLLKEEPALAGLYRLFSDEILHYPWNTIPAGS